MQRHALGGGDLAAKLAGDAEITRHVPADRLASLFDLSHHLRYTDVLFERAMKEGDT